MMYSICTFLNNLTMEYMSIIDLKSDHSSNYHCFVILPCIIEKDYIFYDILKSLI